MSLVRDAAFRAAAAAHFAVDLLNGQLGVLLAVLSAPLGLTNALVGTVSTLYMVLGALSQPVFGWLADRYGTRPVGTIGVSWMAFMFGIAVTMRGPAVLVFLLVASVGSGAFHPAGTMEATLRGKAHLGGREATAASLFFLLGQAGLALGPMIGGAILDLWGPSGLASLLLVVLPIGLYAGLHLASTRREDRAAPSGVRADRGWGGFIPLTFVIAFRAWASLNMVTFLPKYFHDLGFNPGFYGLVSGLFMAGSALGGVAGGVLGDRFVRRDVIVASLLPGILPLVLFPAVGASGWVYLLAPLSGALLGASHSVIVVLAQGMLPGNVGAVSGLVLGFTYATGSLGTVVSGVIADEFGFEAVFLTTAVIVLLAAVVARTLRRESPAQVALTRTV